MWTVVDFTMTHPNGEVIVLKMFFLAGEWGGNMS